MNIIRIKNKVYRYESYWRKDKKDKTTDSRNNIFPLPKASDEPWQNQEMFINKLYGTELILKKRKLFEKYGKDSDRYPHCLICKKKNINTGLFTLNKLRWEDGLSHYISVHNIKPSEDFIDRIFRYDPNPSIIGRTTVQRGLNITALIKNNKKYLKIDKNQILIIDALMKHGSYKWYVDSENNKIFRYSEHAGLLDFNKKGLEKVLVYGNTTRVDQYDDDIYMPGHLADALDYEYIFHTHPATPKPGGRAKAGILYEFPSISDIFHFLDHYNEGKTQGSIIVAAEGMYIIRKFIQNNKIIRLDENALYKNMTKLHRDLQEKAIKKYGSNFTENTFYSKIAQDKYYINKMNELLKKYHLYIDYYPRMKDTNGRWLIDTIYLPVYIIETEI